MAVILYTTSALYSFNESFIAFGYYLFPVDDESECNRGKQTAL
jgi:hypothetical protein